MVAQLATASSRRSIPAGRLFGILAIVVGSSGAAYISGSKYAKVSDASARPRAFVPEFNAVEIPVPERPVPAGVSIRDVRVRYEKFPEHQLPQGAVRDLSRVREMVVSVPLPGGLPIIDANLRSASDVSNPVLGRIPPGMRAMTVRVDATTAVEGWARSGSMVDVLLIEKERTTVVAEHVTVLSAERSLSPIEEKGAAVIPNTVTLLVTKEQCLAINTAVPLGKISLVLRGNSDDESWDSKGFSAQDLSAKGGRSQEQRRVQGVAWFGAGNDRKKYALVDGAWIPAAEPLSAGVPAGRRM